MPSLDRIAKTIVGPNEAHNVGLQKLIELQDLKWSRLHVQQQSHFLRAAKYLQALFDSEPDGWVITSGDDKKVRSFEYDEINCGYASWTSNLDKGLWFARRDDAECFARDDEDAWHIRKASQVRSLWEAWALLEPRQRSAQGAAQSTGPVPRAITTGTPEPPPTPPALPCDKRSTQHLLLLFRAFVIRNVTQWAMGAGDHHHPIWQDVAEELDQHDLNEDPTFGPDWAFIQPMNRKPHAVLLAEYVDQQGAHEAEERGG